MPASASGSFSATAPKPKILTEITCSHRSIGGLSIDGARARVEGAEEEVVQRVRHRAHCRVVEEVVGHAAQRDQAQHRAERGDRRRAPATSAAARAAARGVIDAGGGAPAPPGSRERPGAIDEERHGQHDHRDDRLGEDLLDPERRDEQVQQPEVRGDRARLHHGEAGARRSSARRRAAGNVQWRLSR